MHVSFRGLRALEDFLSLGGGRRQLPGNAETALEGEPWTVLETTQSMLELGLMDAETFTMWRTEVC